MLDGACVFLRDDRLCALHVAGEKELGTPFKLKPAICLLWPLCVVDGELDVGYASFTQSEGVLRARPQRRAHDLRRDRSRRRVDPHDGAPENSRGGSGEMPPHLR